ncbi:MAG TPA: hypothetical protein VFB22_08430 [Candidatus Baltobacteraceae bacterium]|nr:hypothetical protein [Candidatus Baltobacteraceae bacterium]
MATQLADEERVPREPRFGADMSGRPRRGARRSAYIARLLSDLDRVEYYVRDRWKDLDPSTRRTLRDMIVKRPSPLTRLTGAIDLFQMLWAFVRSRSDVVEYYNRSYGVADLIEQRVAEDVWADALSTPEAQEAYRRGVEEAKSGEIVDLCSEA